jgi:hypothetical protein
MMVNYEKSTRSCCKNSRVAVGASEQFKDMAKALFGDSKYKKFQADWNRPRAKDGSLKERKKDCDTELYLLQYNKKYSVNQNRIGALETGTIYSANTYKNCVKFILDNDVMPKLRQILVVHAAIDEMPFVLQLLFSPTTVLKRNGFQTTREGRAKVRLLSRSKRDLSATAGSDGDDDDDDPAVETTPVAAMIEANRVSSAKTSGTLVAKKRRVQYRETLKKKDIVWSGLRGEAGVGQKRDFDVYSGAGKQRTSKKKKK